MHQHANQGTSRIKAAFFLNLAFTLVELVGGFLTNSLAILSDALHDLGDCVSIGLSWYFSKVSCRKPSPQFTYGFQRFSLMAALVNGCILLFGSLFILSKAIPRLMHPEHSNAQGMFVLAILGVLVNTAALLRLREGRTMNERVLTWHLLEDVLGWAAVLVVSVVMMFRDIPILDPLLSILITIYVLWNGAKNLRRTFVLFLQGVPDSLSIVRIEEGIKALPGIRGVHDTHVWSLDGQHNILTAHVVLDESAGTQSVKVKGLVKDYVKREFGIDHATLEMEELGQQCPPKL